MRKGLTIAMLAGTALVGVASAASAQDYQDQGVRIEHSTRTTHQQHRSGVYYRGQEGTTEQGNGSPPAAGEGRVNSDDQG